METDLRGALLLSLAKNLNLDRYSRSRSQFGFPDTRCGSSPARTSSRMKEAMIQGIREMAKIYQDCVFRLLRSIIWAFEVLQERLAELVQRLCPMPHLLLLLVSKGTWCGSSGYTLSNNGCKMSSSRELEHLATRSATFVRMSPQSSSQSMIRVFRLRIESRLWSTQEMRRFCSYAVRRWSVSKRSGVMGGGFPGCDKSKKGSCMRTAMYACRRFGSCSRRDGGR